MHHRPDGTVLDVGRKRRTPPASIRRALAARDVESHWYLIVTRCAAAEHT